ncbi:MAG TPA: hypothetical protein VLE96_05410 [Chlamydiales bacterium]|nr:hypothetical protein [Chlamydiales bacterium]
MSACVDQLKKIGPLFQRDDFPTHNIKEVEATLRLHLLEANVVSLALDAFLNRKFLVLDPLVGDCKCQVRVSMLLDYIEHFEEIKESLELSLQNSRLFIEDVNAFLQKMHVNNIEERILVKRQLAVCKTTMWEYLQSNHLLLQLGIIERVLGIFYLLTATDESMQSMIHKQRRSSYLRNLQTYGKIPLNKMSVDYEIELTKQLGLKEEELSLRQIETKGFVQMTPFFPSFKPIWQKMKEKKRAFVQKTTYFCACGGMQKQTLTLYRWEDGRFLKKEFLPSNEAVTVIKGDVFPGAFTQLKELLQIPPADPCIDPLYFRPCTCSDPTTHSELENIEEIVLANCAQHAQFTNDVEIHWEELGLKNSELKREYDFLLTIAGCSNPDMSRFCIRHIYVATLQELNS